LDLGGFLTDENIFVGGRKKHALGNTCERKRTPTKDE